MSLIYRKSPFLSLAALASFSLAPACASTDAGGSGGSGITGSNTSGQSGSASTGTSGTAAGTSSGASAASGASGASATSGTSGSAGTAGTSGAAGSSSGSGTSVDGGPAGGDASASVGCSGLPLCDGFETDTAGAPPDPTLWHAFLGCNPNATNVAVAGGGLTIGVDSAEHHSGNNSLRVVGGDSCGYYAITTNAFAELGQQIYTRFFARFSGDPQGDGGVATSNHNGFLSMYSGTAASVASSTFFTNYNNLNTATSGQLRLGCQSNVLDWNDIIAGKDTTLPDLDPMGTVLSVSPHAGEWDCYEFHIDETNNNIEFWFNGNSVSGLSWNGTSAQGVNGGWSTSGPPALGIQSFGLGWLQLSVAETAWYDDVALSSSRIGCQ